MKNKQITAILLIGTFLVILIITFFLPSEIPFHINAKGELGWFASKYFLFLLTPVPYLIYNQYKDKKK